MACIYEGMKAEVMLRALVHAAVVLITCISRLDLFIELKGFFLVSRFFLVSLCLQANADVVPKFPSCYYMLLM